MIVTQNLDSFPVFGETSAKSAPDAVKYSAGFQQSDVLPAEWFNWFLAKSSKGISDLNKGMVSVEEELNAVLSEDGAVANESKGQLIAAIKGVISKNINKIVDGEIKLKKLTVTGDIEQEGVGKTTTIEKLYAKEAMLGTKASSQKLTARAEDVHMKNGQFAVWNAVKKQLETKDVLSVENGGTGAKTAKDARTNLGLGNAATLAVDLMTSMNSSNLLGNNIITANMNGTVCTTAANVQQKTVSVAGFRLFEGAIVRVLFAQGNTAANATLNVNNTGAKAIKVYRDGQKIALPTHQKCDNISATNPTYTTVSMDAGVIIELFYDGTDWLVVGNPDVMTSVGESYGYTVKANGMLLQSGTFYLGTTVGTLTLPLAFSVWNSYALVTGEVQHANNSNDTEGYDYVSGVNKRTANTVEFSVADRNREIHWFAIGF